MALQSNEEMLRIADEWIRNFRPSNLVPSTKNAELILTQCLKTSGVISISGMTEAAHAIAAQLELIPTPPAPKVKTADELAVEENTKMFRDYVESVKPQESFEVRVRAETAKKNAEKLAKAQADAKGQLAVAIAGYQCYRTSGAGIDYGATEMVQKELRTVKVGNDFVRTLAVVRQIILELPDHPKMGDVARVVESLNTRLK
jgi:hypothetical protein